MVELVEVVGERSLIISEEVVEPPFLIAELIGAPHILGI